MNTEQIKLALKDRRLGMVSKATGLHVNTLRKIRDGKSTDLKHTTVVALSEYLEGKE